MPKIELFKFVRFWLPDIGSNNKKYVLLQVVAYTPFLILFVAALVRRWRHPMWDSQWLVIDILMLSSVLSALIFWGSPRFRDGNAPILMLYAASALPMIPKKWLGI